ncbi:MAG: hypothetical protein BM555_03160 [Crocinitomix sp. MedPE-SWsnd]|nr:MAG: hypothetical protein BM555_03160 [Crocinitomix sp. MedPE-SWsnd]
MIYLKKSLLICFLFVLSWNINAQIPHDVEAWVGSNLKFKLNKKVSLNISPEIRFDNDISTRKSVFTDLELKLKLSKYWALKWGFRFAQRPNNGIKLRGNFDILFSVKKKKKKLSFRNRLRSQFGYAIQTGKNEVFIRDQVLFKYNLSKLVDPYAGGEIFFKTKSLEFRQFRLLAGLDWKLTNWWDVSTFYIYEREIFNSNPSASNIIGFSSTFKLKKKKQKSHSSL